ncbi:MAG: PQQ-dependent sugar dehydrogenase, partial [Pirellula sp.]
MAIRVMDRERQELGLKADFYFKPTKGNWRVVVSDAEWKATKQAISNWQMLNFNDEGWSPAFDLDQRSSPAKPDVVKDIPKGNNSEEVSVAKRKSAEDAEPIASAESTRSSRKGNSEVAGGEKITISTRPSGSDSKESSAEKNSRKLKQRFTTLPGFDVETVADHSIGSLIAMTFNEFGHIIASVEGDGLVLLYDTNKDGIPDKSRDYCDLVQNVQGILALNGDVYVTGEGPEGNGLYRLVDSDRNGQLEKSELLAKFGGIPGEHGAHQLAFGPDGYLYISIGNHAQLETPLEGYQPFTTPYEGDLVRPRFEDPGGHAMGVKAPGGTVVRYDLTSRKLSLVAGGLRNAYDLAFHPNGTMYLHDSDMEADIGSVWHRPTGLFRVVEGGEFGWRSGWANWPEYYPDRLPSLASTGRGSPTGITVYNHFAFPARYHRAIFTADWSEGRIIALQLDAADRGRVKAEDFVVGTPMNVTDLEVGPDGALYFCTGGR